jgi:hypothetical protein
MKSAIASANQSWFCIPGETTGVFAASMFTRCSRAGSVDELVAEMLMHLLGAVAAPARCATLLQGKAAGRSMAVPVNWRSCWTCEAAARSSVAAAARRAEGEAHHRVKPSKHAGELDSPVLNCVRAPRSSTITELSLLAIGACRSLHPYIWSCATRTCEVRHAHTTTCPCCQSAGPSTLELELPLAPAPSVSLRPRLHFLASPQERCTRPTACARLAASAAGHQSRETCNRPCQSEGQSRQLDGPTAW